MVLADVDEQRLHAAATELAGFGLPVDVAVCDITDRGSVDDLIARADADGDLRAVVHTAGVSPQMGSPERILRINAVGTLNITEASLAVARPSFALVNVASIAGYLYPKFLLPKRIYRLALTDSTRFAHKLAATGNRGPKGSRPGSA